MIAADQNTFFDFKPDLIVEATRLCDQKCKGCYAPNLLAKVENLSAKENFLSGSTLTATLSVLSKKSAIEIIGIRGGEPTTNPYLLDILQAAHAVAHDVFLETHGKWIHGRAILGVHYKNALLDALRKHGSTLKISYDSMHSISLSTLRKTCEILDELHIKWVVAITERNDEIFHASRTKCDWIPDNKIVRQVLALNSSDLIKPKLGVLNIRGEIHALPTNTLDLYPKSSNGAQ